MTALNKRTTRITVQFFGDIALNGQYVTDPGMLRSVIRTVSEQLKPADLRIANWEGPIQGTEGSNTEKSLTVSTTREISHQITPLGINVGLLANNHVFDCLESGFEATVTFMDSQRMAWVGAGRTKEESQRPLHLEVKGLPVVILSYVDSSTNPAVPRSRAMHLNILDPDRALDEVREWSKLDIAVLVSIHCGREYFPCPSPAQRKLSRRLVEAGASVVACHHPHRLQGHEKWKEGYIFYSLGNFLFGSLYPGHVWPEVSEPTTVVTCDIEGRRVVGLNVQHLRLRNGSLRLCGEVAIQHYEKLNRPIRKSDEEYLRHWSRVVAYHNFIFRPMQFVRRNPYPWNWLSKFEKRHIEEFWRLLKGLVVTSNENRLN